MKKDITLIIMAAGMGSRYGGLKQIDPLGPHDEVIMDYSIYDAIKAGFNKIVFVIKEEFYSVFKEKIGDKLKGYKDIKVEYVFQDIKDIPSNFHFPVDRVKPWGTGHAILSCKDIVNEPFAVINADDFYGPSTFKLIHDELATQDNPSNYSMIGFKLGKTTSKNGSVARGICTVTRDNKLISVEEKTEIIERGNEIYSIEGQEEVLLSYDNLVSMNIWGFMPSIFNELQNGFNEFLEKNLNNLKSEFYIPSLVDDLIKKERATVSVIKTSEKWYGVTYKEDKKVVMKALKDMTPSKYPDRYINS